MPIEQWSFHWSFIYLFDLIKDNDKKKFLKEKYSKYIDSNTNTKYEKRSIEHLNSLKKNTWCEIKHKLLEELGSIPEDIIKIILDYYI